MDIFDALVLGIVQGITEFLPISSTGHLILAREIFGISADYGLAIDAVLQLATAFAVLIYFRRDIKELILGFFWRTEKRKIVFALALGTVPAILAGLLLEDYMETTFRSTELVAWTLIAGSFLFLAAEYTAKRYREKGSIKNITPARGLIVGLFQCLALIPGMSRSGATISAGLFLGFTREEAARFGFLLALPIIFGSGLKKALELGGEGILSSIGVPLFVSTLAAFLIGLAAIHYLLRYLRHNTLFVFVMYRVLLAGVVLLFF